MAALIVRAARWAWRRRRAPGSLARICAVQAYRRAYLPHPLRRTAERAWPKSAGGQKCLAVSMLERLFKGPGEGRRKGQRRWRLHGSI
jgi:hypothetical protein